MIRREIIIEAPIDRVFEVVSDLKSYPEFLQTTDSVSIEKIDEKHLNAEFKVRVVKEISYRLAFELKPPTELKWDLIDGDFMKKNTGKWVLSKKSENETLAVYEIDIEFGFLVPKKLVAGLTSVQLPELLESFKQRAENLQGVQNG